MFLLTSVLLLSFGVLCSATEGETCKEGRPSHCFADAPDGPLDFPDSEEALDKICVVFLPKLKCVLEYQKKCPDTPLHSGIDEILDDIYPVMVEVCDKDSELNKALAIHLPCIAKNVQGHEATCDPMVKEVLEEMTSQLNIDFEDEEPFRNLEDRAKYYCTREALGMTCFLASTSVKCGEEAAEISGSVLERFGIFDAVCHEEIRDDIKALVSLVQPLMELGIAAEEMLSKKK